jgi:mono/diheme cytochrome c family protein
LNIASISRHKSASVFLLIAVLSACESSEMGGIPVPDAPPRQYDDAQLSMGKQVYTGHCASCHGAQAQGAVDWRKRDADGHYPAPPLNGSGHTWHHSLEVLENTIRHGSPPGKGKMPAWEGKLNDEQIDAVIAWIQSTWPQPVYDAWFEMQQRGR